MSATTVLFVLSIGKLTAGQEEDYLRSVADGGEEYYLGSRKRPVAGSDAVPDASRSRAG